MKRLLLLLALLPGCTSIDYKAGPVPGLEHMSVEEKVIDASQMYDACSRCGHQGLEIVLACTCINFRTNHAVIWLARGAPQTVIDHERAHGRGYDHTDGQLRTRYASWLRSAKNLPPAPAYTGNTVHAVAITGSD
jgi:hypothetical protein